MVIVHFMAHAKIACLNPVYYVQLLKVVANQTSSMISNGSHHHGSSLQKEGHNV